MQLLSFYKPKVMLEPTKIKTRTTASPVVKQLKRSLEQDSGNALIGNEEMSIGE